MWKQNLNAWLNNKLHKVRTLVKSLNENCSKTYHHSNNSVDESMIQFKRISGLKQYMFLKPVKRGYKVWCLADSVTAFVLKFEIYSGKTDSSGDLGFGERVVLYICSELADSQDTGAFDNFFASCRLTVILPENIIYSIGTVRESREGLTDMLKKNDKLQDGLVLCTATSPKDTTSVTWKYKYGTKTTISCPTAILMYNALMGGVDLFYQLRKRYAVNQMEALNLLLSTRSSSCKFIYHYENCEGRSRLNVIQNSACKAADLWLHFQEAKSRTSNTGGFGSVAHTKKRRGQELSVCTARWHSV
ncbi:hypothetical protein PR048_018258 [Dryococelus australis]|uniref:PiggyBac transposable element-derived protein domain-containing protein n=1 Tax=Dryococelus australis TaxID=614101 RepID=A0ABQ9HBR5_9NEOP|nr:hypothetical protein PR048_018258 [Dryococelus australis]